MSTGYQHTIRFHEDGSGVPVLDSFERKEFNHTSAFTVATSSVVKEDFTGSANDAFVAKFNYPTGLEPDLAVITPVTLLATAKNAVNAVFGDGEAGAPTA